MNIVVCLKAVATNVNAPTPKDDGSGIQSEGDAFMNASDEYALEQALLFKKDSVTKVTAITVGSIKSQDILHVSLAKGADEAIRIDSDEFDPNVVAFLLARAIQTLDYDLILAGVESSDGMSSQVGISVGAQLGVPYVYAVTQVESAADAGSVTVTRELGGGRFQKLEVSKPALLCVQSGIAPLTYTPVVKLIHARRRGIPGLSIENLGIGIEELNRRRKTRILEIKPVEQNTATQWLKGSPQELASQILDKITQAM